MSESEQTQPQQQPVGAGQPPAPTSRRNLWIALAVVGAVLVLVAVWQCTAATVAVPDVVGMTQQQARAAIEDSGLRVGRVSEEPTLSAPPGTVVGQLPQADSQATADSAVDLKVAAIPTVEVPDVVGMATSDAEAELAEVGLQTGQTTGSFSSDADVGTVLTQAPAAAQVVTVGSAVALEISLGTEQGVIPDVVGLTSTDAEQVMESAGFTSTQAKTTSADVAAGVVISQSPNAGTKAETGSSVKLTVSTGEPAA